MLNATMPPEASRHCIAPSPAAAMANRQMAGLRWGTCTPLSPSRWYRSVNASENTRLTRSMPPAATAAGPSIRSRRGIAGLRHGASHPLLRVVAQANYPVKSLPHRFEVGDENHLGKAVGQVAEQVHHCDPALLVERTEDLVQHQEGEGLSGSFGDHLADGKPERQIGDVFLAS